MLGLLSFLLDILFFVLILVGLTLLFGGPFVVAKKVLAKRQKWRAYTEVLDTKIVVGVRKGPYRSPREEVAFDAYNQDLFDAQARMRELASYLNVNGSDHE